MPGQPLLELIGIDKRFHGVYALQDVSFDVRPGEVHALMGENGAGKSTLMNVAAGVFPPDSGTVRIDGRSLALRGPADANRLGIHTVFQELTVLENLDVASNILVGAEPVALGGTMLDRKRLLTGAQQILDRLDIQLNASTPVRRLSTGQRQMVEIARACAEDPKVLILDEPTSSLGRSEEELLFALIARLKRSGVGIIYITHRIAEVFSLSDRVTVLRDGRKVDERETREFDRRSLIRAMVGRHVEDRLKREEAEPPPVLLAAKSLSRPPKVAPVDIELRKGEVLGLAGLMGAGRSELARLIAGVDAPAAGRMTIEGKPYSPRGVGDAVQAGVAYIPEDRKLQGLVLGLSVADNLVLPSLRRNQNGGMLRLGRLSGLVRQWLDRLAIKAKSPSVGVRTLSGGNQQKVVLAKWLAIGPRVVLLDEPTRGVDVGAKVAIHRLIRDLARQGAAILVISSELPELLVVSDRIAVMSRGHLVDTVDADTASEESLLALAFQDPVERSAA